MAVCKFIVTIFNRCQAGQKDPSRQTITQVVKLIYSLVKWSKHSANVYNESSLLGFCLCCMLTDNSFELSENTLKIKFNSISSWALDWKSHLTLQSETQVLSRYVSNQTTDSFALKNNRLNRPESQGKTWRKQHYNICNLLVCELLHQVNQVTHVHIRPLKVLIYIRHCAG